MRRKTIIFILLAISCSAFPQTEGMNLNTRHSSAVTAIFFSPDNSRIITHSPSEDILWDTRTGLMIKSTRNPEVDELDYPWARGNPNRKVVPVSGGGELKLQDYWIIRRDRGVDEAKYIIRSDNRAYEFNQVAVAEDRKLILAANDDGNIYLNRLDNGIGKTRLRAHSAGVTGVAVSDDELYMVSSAKDYKILMWDMDKNTVIRRFDSKVIYKSALAFSENGEYLFAGDASGTLFKIDLDLSRLEFSSAGIMPNTIKALEVYNDEQLIAGGLDNKVYFIDLNTLETLNKDRFRVYFMNPFVRRELKAVRMGQDFENDQYIKAITLDGDRLSVVGKTKPFYANFEDWEIKHKDEHTAIYDMEKGKRVSSKDTEGKTKKQDPTRAVHRGADLQARSLPDGSIQLWDAKGNKLLSTLVVSVDGMVVYTPERYYMGTGKINELVNYFKGDEAYPVEQFDLKYNRPDLVLRSYDRYDEDLLDQYYRSYLKRIEKMGFSEEFISTEFHLPEVEIENTAELPIATKEKTVELDIRAKDSQYALRSVQVWVNSVPLFGRKGKLIGEGEKTQSLRVPVTLTSGDNQIQVSCLNEKGAESLMKTVNIEYLDKEKPDLYLITLGVDKYEDAEMNLNYAVKDCKDLAELFRDRNKYFANIYIDTLMNSDMVKENVFQLREKLMQTKECDQVILFAAGHGILDEELDLYLATYDMDFWEPAKRGIPYDRLEAMLDSIPARNKLMMMDACHSGEIDKTSISEVNTREEEGAENTDNDGSSRGTEAAMDLEMKYHGSLNLMKELFDDLRRGSGTVVISSAGGLQAALEAQQWNNGAFTYSLIRGLKSEKADANKDGKITVSELQAYVSTTVPELTNGKQRPTFRQENLDNDFRLW